MKAMNVFFAAGLAASATAFAAPGTPVVNNGPAIEVVPSHYQVIYNIDGQMVAGPELPYPGSNSRWTGFALSYDKFLGDETAASSYPPIGGNLAPCALAATSRYFFGTAARNAHYSDEYAGVAAGQIGQKVSALAFAWTHSPAVAEPMRIGLQWWNEANTDCAGFAAGSDSIVAARGFLFGIVFTFGGGAPQPPGVGYFFSSPDVSALSLPNVPDADGAVEGLLIQELDGDPGTPGNQIVWATRSQPMLWGTQQDYRDAAGLPVPGPFPSFPGAASQAPHWDDDGGTTPEVVSGTFTTTAPNECYNYAFAGICVRPLGSMIAFFRQNAVAPAPFTLISPADGATVSLTPTLEWEFTTPAPSSYTVRVSTQADLSSPVVNVSGLVSTTFDVLPGSLQACTTYFWGVRAIGGGGLFTDSTPFSRSFNTVGSDLTADFNGDNSVDFFDYLDFVAAFDAELPTADFNGDNTVDFFDYLDFAAAFARNC
jgi:hypothetical protein